MPTPKHLEYANRNGQVTTLASLTMGRRLYIKRCSACHNLKRPTSLLPSEWPEMVERMSEVADLKPDQVKIITQYLVAVVEAAKDTTSAPQLK